MNGYSRILIINFLFSIILNNTEPIASNPAVEIDQQDEDPFKAPGSSMFPGDSQSENDESVTRFNFAARSSGATILGHSKDAKEAGAILSGDEDKYLMMPTAGNMWFAVKLSENVMVEKIEINNLEHYSSAIRRFVVFSGDKWPSEKWTAQGQFEAKFFKKIFNEFTKKLNNSFSLFLLPLNLVFLLNKKEMA